jgi:hypothetical protein
MMNVVCRNLNLGLATKAKRVSRVQAKKSVRMKIHTPKWALLLGVGVMLDSRPLESDCRGQNTSHWRILYIIGKLLKCRWLKWSRMTRLEIYNTSYGKKKGQESNWQFDSRPQKVRNRSDFCACIWIAIYRWKALDKSYNFALDLIQIGSLSKKLWPRKVAKIQP